MMLVFYGHWQCLETATSSMVKLNTGGTMSEHFCVLQVSAVLGNGYWLDSMTEILKVGCWCTTDLVIESCQVDVL